MTPGDEVIITYANGHELRWVVVGVHLGATNQESVIELIPVGQQSNTEGRTLCPAALLYVLSEGGQVVIRESAPVQ
jgi:hypothetical protein